MTPPLPLRLNWPTSVALTHNPDFTQPILLYLSSSEIISDENQLSVTFYSHFQQ